MNADVFEKIAPQAQAGYTEWIHDSYPVYFFAKEMEKTEKGSKLVARMIVSADAEGAQLKTEERLNRLAQAPIFASKIKNVNDAKDRKRDSFENLLYSLLISKRLLDAYNYLPFFDSFFTAYISLNAMSKLFERGEAVSVDDLTSAVTDTASILVSDFSGLSRNSPLPIPDFTKNIFANSVSEFGRMGQTLAKIGGGSLFEESLDEVIHGAYLKGLRPMFHLEDFTRKKTLQKSKLVCQYYASQASSPSDRKETSDPLFVVWPHSKIARALRGGDSLDIEFRNRSPLKTRKYNYEEIQRSGHFVELNGRWVRTDQNTLVFATISDPSELMSICAEVLNHDELIPKIHREAKIGGFAISTGNHEASRGHAIEFYTPLNVWDGHAKTAKAVHVDQNILPIAEAFLKASYSH